MRVPLSGQVWYFALPLRVSSIPSTVTGSGSVASTGSAVAATDPFDAPIRQLRRPRRRDDSETMDETGDAIDHVGMYLGLDVVGGRRFISSRKKWAAITARS